MDCPRGPTLRGPTAWFLPGGGTIGRNRTRMAGETTMNLRNGSASAPPNGVAKDMGELTHDMRVARRASVRAVQKRLPRRPERTAETRRAAAAGGDCGGRHGAGGPDFPCRAARAGRRPLAGGGLFDRALGGFIAALALGVVGWSRICGAGRVFERSREELTRNMTWIKHVLKRPPSQESRTETLSRAATMKQINQ